MLFEKLSDEEVSMIDNYRKTFAFDDYYKNQLADIKYILREWESQKKDLFKMFGDQLILSKEIEYVKSEKELNEDISEMINHKFGRAERASKDFYENYRNWIDKEFPFNYEVYSVHNLYDYTSNEDLEEDPEIKKRKERNKIHNSLKSLIEPENLIPNIYSGESFSITLPDGKELKINSGCKILKVLGKIAQNFEIEGFEDFRICHSQVLNQKALKGTLCLSIHPLDYMTMSDNCGWTSCMSWIKKGSYRQGTVEMMNSPTVVVAYLASEKDMEISLKNGENFSWNNKKWRKLFVVDKDCIVSVKDYPYYNKELTQTAMEWLKELAEKNLGWSYENQMIDWDGIDEIYSKSLDHFITLEFSLGYMYNDFGSAKNHCVYLNNNLECGEFYYLEIPYSGYSECMGCGELDPYSGDEEESGLLVCNQCESPFYCEYCGQPIHDERNLYEVDNVLLCESCYENKTSSCVLTEECHLIDNMKEIYIISDNAKEEILKGKSTMFPYRSSCSYYDIYYEEDFEEEMLKPEAKIHFLNSNGHIYYCVYFGDLNKTFRNYLGLSDDYTNNDFEEELSNHSRRLFLKEL